MSVVLYAQYEPAFCEDPSSRRNFFMCVVLQYSVLHMKSVYHYIFEKKDNCLFLQQNMLFFTLYTNLRFLQK